MSAIKGGSRESTTHHTRTTPTKPPPTPLWEGSWQLVPCKICRYVWYVFSEVHIMLSPNQKPSSYSLVNLFTSYQSVTPFLGGAPSPPLRKILHPTLVIIAFARRHPNLVFLWYKGRNFRAITGDCRSEPPLYILSGASRPQEIGLLWTRFRFL